MSGGSTTQGDESIDPDTSAESNRRGSDSPTVQKSFRSAAADLYGYWLYEPTTFSERAHYPFFAVNPAEIVDHQPELHVDTFSKLSQLAGAYPFSSLPLADIYRLVTFKFATVLYTRLNAQRLATELVSSPFEPAGTVNDFDCYTSPGPLPTAIGLRNSTIIRVALPPIRHAETSAIERLRAVIMTETDAVNRYVDTVDAMADLLSIFDDETLVTGRTYEPTTVHQPEYGEFRNQVATGHSYTITGATAHRQHVLVFESERDVTMPDIEYWVSSTLAAGRAFTDLHEITVGRDGPRAIIAGPVDTETITF